MQRVTALLSSSKLRRKTHHVLARNYSLLIGSSRGSPNLPLAAQYFNSAAPKIFTLLPLLSFSAHTQIQAITLCSKFAKHINSFIT
jgi:hypothetical protein